MHDFFPAAKRLNGANADALSGQMSDSWSEPW